MSEIKDYKIRGGEQGVLYAMLEEDTRILKHFQPNLFCIETAMGLGAEDLIEGVVKHNRLDEPSSTQRLVKIKIESVEYMKSTNTKTATRKETQPRTPR